MQDNNQTSNNLFGPPALSSDQSQSSASGGLSDIPSLGQIAPTNMSFIPKIQPPTQQISIGGAESGGATIKVETGPTNYEKGDAKTPEVEAVREQVESIEKKEFKPNPLISPVYVQKSSTQTTQSTDDTAEKVKGVKEKVTELFRPKFTGLPIDESILNDVENIRVNAGKGDPNLTRTAILLLLQRFINKGAK